LCPVLIDRTTELDTLTSALDAAAQGRGSAIFVTGDAGVGKSRLTKDLSARAAAQGFHVLTGRGTESTVPVPYRPISEALMSVAREGVAPDSPGIAEYRTALGSLVPEWTEPGAGGAEISPVILGEAVLRVLTMPGWRAGLLVLEDLHWADPETLAIVEYLADNVGGAKALCLITQRQGQSSLSAELLQSVAARRVANRIDVPRLTPSAVAQMAAACLEVQDVPAEVRRLLADCDGLPFAVEEILAAAVSSGELVRDDGGWRVDRDISTRVPDSIVGSVRNRLAALGPSVADVIVAAAIFGRQFDWTLLPHVAGVSRSVVLNALHRARELQLIEPVGADGAIFRFRHSLTRDAIVSNLLPPDLTSRSAAAAAAIEEAHPDVDGSWCELAAELHAAAGQSDAAARLMLVAGRRALRQGALSSATTALEDARQLLADSQVAEPELGIEIDEVLAETLALAGDYAQLAPVADDLITRLKASGANPRREALVRLRVASTRPEDHLAETGAQLAAADAIASRLHDVELTSRLDLAAARRALAEGDMDEAAGLAHRSLATAEKAGLSGWATEVALGSLEVLGRRERVRDFAAARTVFERARQIADGTQRGVYRIRAMQDLGTIDLLESGSGSRLAEVRELAHRAGVLSTATTIELQLANLWSLGTDLEKALVAAQRSERGAAQLGIARMVGMATALEAIVRAIQGDAKQAEEVARRAESVLPGDPEILFTTWGHARVLAWLFRDDLPRAIKASNVGMSYHREALRSLPPGQSFYSPLQAPMLAPRRAWGLYALLQAISDDADGRAAVKEARESGVAASWNLGCLGYCDALIEGRDGNTTRASALAEEANGHFAPFAPWWTHLVRRLVAPSAFQDGWGDPVAWMRDAAAELDATGHDKVASACRGILRRAGERVPRSGRGSAKVPPQMRRLGVTSREMDVFLLVANGFSNSEIASRLYISPKTVETHIASLIAKTGQAGRRELVAHAARFARSLGPVARIQAA